MPVQTTHGPDKTLTPAVRSLIALGGFGADTDQEMEYDNALANANNGGASPHPVPVAERVRRLPEALLLTAGYYGSRIPAVAKVLNGRRSH